MMSMAFHPQTDGASEHAIHTTAQILHAMAQPDQCDWAEKMLMVEYALNLSISSSMGFMPFELNYGHMPEMMSHMDRGVRSWGPGVPVHKEPVHAQGVSQEAHSKIYRTNEGHEAAHCKQYIYTRPF